MEEEIWKVVERLPKCEISNMGRLRNTESKQLYRLHLHYGCPSAIVRCKGKRISLHIAQEVWRAFGTGKATTHMHVLHRDRNNTNCRFDNLYVAMDGNAKVQQWQVDLFLEKARTVIMCELKKMGFTSGRYGWDVDNIIGDALYFGWKYLPTLKSDSFTLFYLYMKKCLKWAIAKEGRNGKMVREASLEMYYMSKTKQEQF